MYIQKLNPMRILAHYGVLVLFSEVLHLRPAPPVTSETSEQPRCQMLSSRACQILNFCEKKKGTKICRRRDVLSGYSHAFHTQTLLILLYFSVSKKATNIDKFTKNTATFEKQWIKWKIIVWRQIALAGQAHLFRTPILLIGVYFRRFLFDLFGKSANCQKRTKLENIDKFTKTPQTVKMVKSGRAHSTCTSSCIWGFSIKSFKKINQVSK